MKYLYILIIVSFLSSCKQDKGLIRSKVDFKSEGKEIDINLSNIGNPCEMICKDSLIFILDYYHKHNISIVDIKNKKHIQHIAPKGRGPKEVQHATSIWIEDNKLGVFDCSMKNIIKYNICRDSVIFSKSYSLKNTKYNIYQVESLNDSINIYTGGFYPHRYLMHNIRNNEMKYFGKYPFDGEIKLPNEAFPLTFQSKLQRLNDSCFVSAVSLSPSIEFYKYKNNEFELLKSLNYEKPIVKPEITELFRSVSVLPTNIYGFMSISRYKNYILALYSGRSDKDYKKRSSYGNKVIVYNQKGDVLQTINLSEDVREICTYKNEIIGIVDFPSLKLYSFKIPKL